MRYFVMLLSVASILVLVAQSQAFAADGQVAGYLAQTSRLASARVAAAGVDVSPGLRVKVHVDSDGRLTGVRVVDSSGSLETDAKAQAALQRFHVAAPPVLLSGAELTVAIAPQTVQASLPQAKVP